MLEGLTDGARKEVDVDNNQCKECGQNLEVKWVACPFCGKAVEHFCLELASACLVCPETGIEFVKIPPGKFKMIDCYDTVHNVTVESFFLSKYLVTQQQWQKVMKSNPSFFKGPDRPVENVSWNDCQSFVRKLSQVSGFNYGLPTEAEWEYACRSGGKNERWAGCNHRDSLGLYAWFDENSDDETHPVGQKRPNGLGLYDMSGNVQEWCDDGFFAKSSRPDSPSIHPRSGGGTRRTIRGGSCHYHDKGILSNYTDDALPDHRVDDLGFRLAVF